MSGSRQWNSWGGRGKTNLGFVVDCCWKWKWEPGRWAVEGVLVPCTGQKAAAGGVLSQYLGEWDNTGLGDIFPLSLVWGSWARPDLGDIQPFSPVQGRERGAAAKERPKSGKEHNLYFLPVLPTGLAKKEHKITTAVEKSLNCVPVSTDVSISHWFLGWPSLNTVWGWKESKR